MPYMPQLMGIFRPKITEVLQTELHRKDQIKSAIVVSCRYSIVVNNGDGTASETIVDLNHRVKCVQFFQKRK